jgi:hypothetical protein
MAPVARVQRLVLLVPGKWGPPLLQPDQRPVVVAPGPRQCWHPVAWLIVPPGTVPVVRAASAVWLVRRGLLEVQAARDRSVRSVG